MSGKHAPVDQGIVSGSVVDNFDIIAKAGKPVN
jgi:hypothetical protein